MILRVSTLLGFIALGLCIDPELTRPVTKCHRSASNYSTCVINAIRESWPKFIKDGLPEMNIPVLDPLFYEHFHIFYNTTEMHAVVDANNSTIIGFERAQFLDIRTRFANDIFRVEIDTWWPEGSVAGNATVVGTVGPFRLNNTGYYNISAEDVSVTWIIWGPVINDKWIIEHFHMIPIVKKAWIKLHDFTNSKEIDNLLEDFGNEFWPGIYRAIGPIFFRVLEPMFIEGANNLFTHVSFSKVFPK